jgi:hypothetical protein
MILTPEQVETMRIEQVLRAQIKQVESEPCKCVSCDFCGGAGNYWVDLDGTIGPPGDDLGDLETCDECGGSGTVETCDRCILLADMERDLEELRP